MLPEGIGLIPLFLNIRRGTEDEFETMMPHYEKLIALLAEQNCDIIHPNGAPPFMVHGFKGEAKIVAGWEKKYKTRISSVAQNHVRALKAVKAKSFVGATYFPDKLNAIFAKYFEDAGFKVRSMAGIDVPFNKAQELSGEQIYAHIKKNFLKTKGADAIYMLGSGWRTLNIIDLLEQDLQVPVVHPVTARVWEFQKWLNVREPRNGFGCMLRDLPNSCRRSRCAFVQGVRRHAVQSPSNHACPPVPRRRTDGDDSGVRPNRRAILPGQDHHRAGRHLARRHQRHHGAVRRQAFQPLHPRQSDDQRPVHARRRRPGDRQPHLQRHRADGLTLAKLERATPQLAIQGYPQAKFDPTKLSWLGSMSSYGGDAYLMLLNPDTPIKSVDDIRVGAPGKITLGANNAASSNLIFGIIAKEALNLNINVVRGYTGAAPMFLAMQRKEIDGQFVGISSVKTGQRAMWEKRAFKVPVLFGRTSRHPLFPDVPTGRELTKDPAMLALIDFAEIPFFMSLPFVAPPGVPADRVKALQEAFMAMCRDKDVLAEAEKLGIEMSPIDAEEILRLVGRMAATPKDVIARYSALGAEKGK